MNAIATTTAPTNAYSLPGQGRFEAIMGVTQIYKMESRQTAGSLLCMEITIPPGQGIPPHTHRDEDESFYVIAGRVLIEGEDLGDTPVALDAGSFFHGPRGRLHGFHCEGPETARILVFLSPAARTEEMFARLAELTKEFGKGLDPARVAAVASEYGITVAARA